MKIGFVGLGRMGGNMIVRLLKAHHEVLVYDRDPAAVAAAVYQGAAAASGYEELVSRLKTDSTHAHDTHGTHPAAAVVWLMIPSNVVDAETDRFLDLLPEGSILIDGGNSDYRETVTRARRSAAKKVHFVDVGTSGGILGKEKGYSLMVGGDPEAVNTLSPIFDALAPADGWHHFGEPGSGHYTKMVHNAIEYGLMEAYAEGYRLLKEGPYTNLDLAAAGRVWQHGSIIESMLNGLAAEIFVENPTLAGIDGFVHESGETRWAIETAKTHGIALPAIEESFDVRIRSQHGDVNFATRTLAALRNKFGGHTINRKD